MLLCLFISCNIFQNIHLFSCYQKNDTIQIRSNKKIWLLSNEKCLSLSHNKEATKQSSQVYWIYLFLNFAPGEKSFANVSSRRLFRSVYWHTRVLRMSTSVSSSIEHVSQLQVCFWQRHCNLKCDARIVLMILIIHFINLHLSYHYTKTQLIMSFLTNQIEHECRKSLSNYSQSFLCLPQLKYFLYIFIVTPGATRRAGRTRSARTSCWTASWAAGRCSARRSSWSLGPSGRRARARWGSATWSTTPPPSSPRGQGEHAATFYIRSPFVFLWRLSRLSFFSTTIPDVCDQK